MRIISGFHDYYDCISKLGIDSTIVFNRRTRHTQTKMKKNLVIDDNYAWFGVEEPGRSISIVAHTIGFCGSVYPVFNMSTVHPRTKEEKHIRTVSTVEEVYAGVRQFAKEVSLLSRVEKQIRANEKDTYIWGSAPLSVRGMKKWHERARTIGDKIFVRLGVPYFEITGKYFSTLGSKYDIVLCPNLGDLHFQAIKSTWEAYQEIMAYLSGPLAKHTDAPQEISDIDLAESKGFNKESFRTDSPGKKKRRRNK